MGNLSFINQTLWNDMGVHKSTANDFLAAMNGFGLVASMVIADGQIHRCSDGNKRANDNGWYVCHQLDGDIFGSFGSWSAGKGSQTFNGKSLQSEEQKRRISELLEQQKQSIAELRLEAATKADSIIEVLPQASASNPYAERKKIIPYGALADEDKLIIPAYNWDGKVQSMQTIFPDGSKRFLKNASTKGAFFFIGSIIPNKPVLLCEGYATGCSLQSSTNLPVIVAFDCGNLQRVANGFRELHSNKIIICADNDENGIGIKKAQETKLHVRDCEIVYPEFNEGDKGTDFNDLYCLYGKESIVNKLHPYMDNKFSIYQWTANAYIGEPEPIDWLIDGSLPSGKPGIFASVGGLGKSFLALDTCLNIASGIQADVLGGKIVKQGRALMLTAEDDFHSVHRRLSALDPNGERRFKASENLSVVPMPNAGGALQLVEQTPNGARRTAFFDELKAQIVDFKPLIVFIDPLQSFISADMNSDQQAAQYYCNLIAEICAESGASIITTHHMVKDSLKGITTTMEARAAIRGVSGLVDGMRWAYALWAADEQTSRGVLYQKGKGDYSHGRVALGAVVKANDRHNNNIHAYIRDDEGFLRDYGKLDLSNVQDQFKVDAPAFRRREQLYLSKGMTQKKAEELLYKEFGICSIDN